MKTLIMYCSNHGFVEKCAGLLNEKMEEKGTLLNLKSKNKVNLDAFDTVIIGGSIHAGKMQKQLKQFLTDNESLLLNKQIGLFICCSDQEKALNYLDTEIPQNIVNKAFIKVHLGHAYYMEKLNFMFKAILKKVGNIEKSEENIRHDQMDILLKEMDKIEGDLGV